MIRVSRKNLLRRFEDLVPRLFFLPRAFALFRVPVGLGRHLTGVAEFLTICYIFNGLPFWSLFANVDSPLNTNPDHRPGRGQE
jgi:hypothetical protein